MYFPYSFWTLQNVVSGHYNSNGKSRVNLQPISTGGLVSYYSFNNSLNFGKDSVNVNNLTTTGAPNAVNGVILNGMGFSNGNSYLSGADATGLRITSASSATIAFWVYPNSGATSTFLITKDVQDSYAFLYESTGRNTILFGVFDSSTSLSVNVEAVVNTDAWSFVVAWYDKSLSSLNIQINNGNITTGHIGTPNGHGAAGPFVIGEPPNLSSTLVYFDEMSIWQRTLSATERGALYNNGFGFPYSFNN